MTDTKVVLAVVCGLITFALGALAGTIWLIDQGAAEGAIAVVAGLTGTALGSLGTMLASTRSGGQPPAPVSVVNTSEPVVVEEVKPRK